MFSSQIPLESAGLAAEPNGKKPDGRIADDLGGTAKDGAARHLANVIVWSFCVAVAWLLLESGYLLFKVTQNIHPAVAATGVESSAKTFDFISAAVLPFLKESASTITSIFGSTLGFVLGYYFKNDSK